MVTLFWTIPTVDIAVFHKSETPVSTVTDTHHDGNPKHGIEMANAAHAVGLRCDRDVPRVLISQPHRLMH